MQAREIKKLKDKIRELELGGPDLKRETKREREQREAEEEEEARRAELEATRITHIPNLPANAHPHPRPWGQPRGSSLSSLIKTGMARFPKGSSSPHSGSQSSTGGCQGNPLPWNRHLGPLALVPPRFQLFGFTLYMWGPHDARNGQVAEELQRLSKAQEALANRVEEQQKKQQEPQASTVGAGNMSHHRDAIEAVLASQRPSAPLPAASTWRSRTIVTLHVLCRLLEKQNAAVQGELTLLRSTVGSPGTASPPSGKKDLFDCLDRNGDGVVTREEFISAFDTSKRLVKWANDNLLPGAVQEDQTPVEGLARDLHMLVQRANLSESEAASLQQSIASEAGKLSPQQSPAPTLLEASAPVPRAPVL